MSLLSKLFGNEAEKAARKLINNIAGETINNAINQNKDYSSNTNYSNVITDTSDVSDTAPTAQGGSWGDIMPAEENQYSFHGGYLDYFKTVFSAEFPEYVISYEKAEGRYREAIVCTFAKEGRKAVVVELMSENSTAKKLREACVSEGIPYVRFYYDHDGWWNTRSYVVDRVKSAINA